MPRYQISDPMSLRIIPQSIKKTLDHQMAGWLFHGPIVPLYFIEDCRICNLGTNMANSFHTLGNKINIFVLAQTCYSKHLVYVERQRREHAIKLQSFPEYDVPLWSFTNVYEMTMFILLFDYIFKVKSVSLKFCHDMFANFLNGIPLLDHLPLSTILIKRQENRRSSTLKACTVQAPS